MQYRDNNKKLSKCSVYTIGTITRVYTLRGQTRAAYYYKINGKNVEKTKGVNNFDTNESWSVDMDKLRTRRLMLQVYCNDINVHRVLWDVAVPDTLRYIPTNGWKQIPFKAKSTE